jgi:hypothetical protein
VLEVAHSPKSTVKLFIGSEKSGFVIADLNTGATEKLRTNISKSGQPIKVVDLNSESGIIVICYESMLD